MLPAIATHDEAFAVDAAEFVAGTIGVDRLAALHGITEDEALSRFDTPAVQREVEQRAAQAAQSGKAIRAQAREALAKAVTRIAMLIDDPDTSTSALLEAGKFLERLAGITPVETEKPTSGFSLTIILPKGFVPPPSARDTFRVIDTEEVEP